jgi:hypothetical protein
MVSVLQGCLNTNSSAASETPKLWCTVRQHTPHHPGLQVHTLPEKCRLRRRPQRPASFPSQSPQLVVRARWIWGLVNAQHRVPIMSATRAPGFFPIASVRPSHSTALQLRDLIRLAHCFGRADGGMDLEKQ